MNFAKKKQDDGGQQLNEGFDSRKFECFRCGRSKSDCDGERNCKNLKKANGYNVSSKDTIEVLINEYQESKRARFTSGIQHVIDGEIVPSWKDTLDEEESYDGNLVAEWNFAQDGVGILNKHKANASKREVNYDLCDDKNHMHDQSENIGVSYRDRDDRLCRTLLD